MNAEQLKRFLSFFGLRAYCVDFQIFLKNESGEIVSTHNSLTSLQAKLFPEEDIKASIRKVY
jgi:hypothetical protein